MSLSRHLTTVFGALLMLPSTFATTPSIVEITKRLDSLSSYSSRAKFSVSMPQLVEDIVYDVSLQQDDTHDDPLGSKSYLIEWSLKSDTREGGEGFAAYFTGNHFRYSGERLQEYHLEWDSIPFKPEIIGSRSQGVHRSVQFFNMLPQAIADELRRITTDSAYNIVFHADTLISGRRLTAVDAVMLQDGMTAIEAEYVFDPVSLLPLRIHLENNPGSISEQTVHIEYLASADTTLLTINEQMLIDRHPDVFSLYRESNFSIENLTGQRLPGFALPTTTGDRYSRRSGDPLRTHAIVALLDASGMFSPRVIDHLREAVDRLPVNADLIMAFADNNVDRIESVVPMLRPDEHLLMSSSPLIRDCGAASLPTILLVGQDGIVKNVIIGYNKDLTSDVIQKMALIN